MTKSLTNKQKAFIAEYLKDFNATQAAIRAGYSERTAYSIGQENLTKPEISKNIQTEINTRLMSAEEAMTRTARIARFDVSPYVIGVGKNAYLDVDAMKDAGFGDLIRGIKTTDRSVEVKTADPDAARKTIIDIHEKTKLPTGKEDDPFFIRSIEIIAPGGDS